MKKQKLHVVIVGGGFAGLKLVRKLRFDNDIHITLVSDSEEFRYSPALYRTATGYKSKESCIPIASMLAGLDTVTFVKGEMLKVDPVHRTLSLRGGDTLHYDYAVLALGVVTSYFGIPGLEELSYGIKSVSELERLRTHLHQEMIEDRKLDKNYVVVGAGPTGVELAAALRSYLTKVAKRHGIRKNKVNIELIEAAPRVLPSMPLAASKLVAKRLRKLGVKLMLNQKVERETPNTLRVSGRSIPTHTVIWTAGVTNNPFFARNSKEFALNERKKVIVNDHLEAHERVFVIGDNAATQYSGLALTAVHNAGYVAKVLRRRVYHKNVHPYRPFKPISVIPVGPNWAIVQWGNIVFGGRLGALVRIGADLIGYSDVMGWWRSIGILRHHNETEEACHVCRASLKLDGSLAENQV